MHPLERPMTSFEREVASPSASESGLGAVKDLEYEFARALAQAELYGAKLDDRLRHVIHRVVDEAKASGKSADEIVALIKDIARRGGFARPDAVRPVSSFPADRLVTKAITASIERYHASDDELPSATALPSPAAPIGPADLALIASGGDARGAVSARLRAVLHHENADTFARALASYVRSSAAQGSNLDEVLAGVDRILSAVGDSANPASPNGPARAPRLVLRGLLLALYEERSAANEGVSARGYSAPRVESLAT